MRLVPTRANQLVVVVFANVPDVPSLQVVLVASCNRAHANSCDVDSRDGAESELRVIVDATDAPNSTHVSQVSSVEDLGALVTVKLIRACTEDHDMPIGHAHSYASEIVKGAHAVDAFRCFHRLQKLKRKLVVNEDATIATADKYFVSGHDRAVHLTALNVESLEHVGRISAEHIDVILCIVHQEDVFSDSLDVLDLMSLDPVDVSRRLVFFVQVIEVPHISQVLLPEKLISVLGGLLDLIQHLNIGDVDLCGTLR